jgi:hypothetical protein
MAAPGEASRLFAGQMRPTVPLSGSLAAQGGEDFRERRLLVELLVGRARELHDEVPEAGIEERREQGRASRARLDALARRIRARLPDGAERDARAYRKLDRTLDAPPSLA